MYRLKNKHPFSGFKSILTLTVTLGTALLIGQSTVIAGTFADDACDPQYYESLEARAWLEAQREITQNQNLIFKSDSVLEYTCFDSFLGVLADRADGSPSASQLFTDTNRWGTPPSNVRNSLNAVVATAMDRYQTANFNHSLLGGRSTEVHDLPASLPSGAYTCDTMNRVWEDAKCMDFIDEAAEDGFFTFAEYEAAPDKRFLPTRCSKTADFQTNMDTATLDSSTPWEESPIRTFYDLIYPSSGCSGAFGPFESIFKTGLIVNRTSGSVTDFEEHVCVVPGCYWEPSSATAGTCEEYSP
ncbi:MAG: hypothetical protein JKY71_04970 [Alphaproteobacteria bacterium]|nr:hypothetical protein [Alphaproteobacteria bacterium]